MTKIVDVAESDTRAQQIFDATFDQFMDATSGRSAIQQNYCIADRIIQLQFLDAQLADQMTVALQERRSANDLQPDLVIHAWQQVPPISGLAEYTQFQHHFKENVGAYNHSDQQVMFRRTSQSTYMSINRPRAVALWWTYDIQQVPVWERAAPFQHIFNLWFAGHDRYMIHAGAIGDNRSAILLTGKGGSGKSTSALAGLQNGLVYLADDYCMVGVDPAPTVFNLYGTGKLKVDGLELLPAFQSTIIDVFGTDHQAKSVVLASELPGATIPASRPLKGIIMPSIRKQATSRLVPVSPGRALMSLAPTSLLQLPGEEARKLRALGELLRQLPCFTMEMGQDFDQITELFLKVLACR